MIDDQIRELIREIVAEAWAQFFRAHRRNAGNAAQSSALALPAPSIGTPLVETAPGVVVVDIDLHALFQRPCATPDRAAYQRPALDDVAAVTTWMVYERSSGWWLAPSHAVRHAAVYWLAMRERVTGVWIS